MTRDEYEKLAAADQKHFLLCPDCRQMLDLRSLEDVFLHLARHKSERQARSVSGSGKN
jgi:hypothetical protein